MKGVSFIGILFLLLAQHALMGQYYVNFHQNVGTNPGGLNFDPEYPVGSGLPAQWQTIFTSSISAGAHPQFTGVYSIPFNFQFNGVSVSQFKVSTNGILTFDTSTVINPDSNNLNLPNSQIPDNSIVIWGIFPGGSGDYITRRTFGSGPYRQHWIHFNSYTAINAPWTYWSIVLEETTNKIYVVDQRTNLGTFNLSLTIGLQIDSAIAIEAPGSPSITSYSNNDFTVADNSYWEFIPGARSLNDVKLLSVLIDSITNASSPIPIKVLIKNMGADTLRSVELSWTIDSGQTINKDTIYPNLITHDTVSFQHSILWNANSIGRMNELKVWLSNPNDTVDSNFTNDTLSKNIFLINGLTVTRNPLVEILTTAICNWCVDARVQMDTLFHYVPNVIPVEAHSCWGYDAMTNNSALALCGKFAFNTIPVAIIDRNKFSGENFVAVHRTNRNWINKTIERNNLRSPLSINAHGTYNMATANVNINASFSFVDHLYPGQLRVGVLILEDSISGSNSHLFNQRNAYAGQTGHPFANYPSVIVGFHHKFVLREILPAIWGDSTVLPTTIQLNQAYSKNWSFTLPSYYDSSQVYLVAFAAYHNPNSPLGNEIINAKRIKLTDLTIVGLEENLPLNSSLKIYPNPTDLPYANVEFRLAEASSVQVRITDVTGKVISFEDFGTMVQGHQMIQLNTDHLENGFYFVNLKVGEEEISRKISILK